MKTMRDVDIAWAKADEAVLNATQLRWKPSRKTA